MGTIVKDGTIVYTHIDDIPRGAMEIRIPVPEGYVAEIISDGLIAIRPVESEDERIVKDLIGGLMWQRDNLDRLGPHDDNLILPGFCENVGKHLSWLEKQKDSPMPEDTVVFQEGVEEGRRLEREEQKPTPDWMPKFLDELRSKKNYFDWDEHRDIEGHILAIIKWIAPDYFHRKEKEQKPLPGFDDLTPDEKMNHPLYLEGFDAGREVGRVEAEQKPDWSEEDEKNVGLIISFCDTLVSGAWFSLSNEQLISISKTLKAVHPVKQEWSEEDEKMVETICKEGDLKPSEKRWLKSIKNRGNSLKRNSNSPSWKPSEEQMRALKVVVDEHWDVDGDALYSLYTDLKKLM